MFQTITFRDQNKNDANHPLDIGMLLECMIFYEKTNVIASQGILKQLLLDIGIDNLIELIEEGFLNIIYTESFVGIKTDRNSIGVEFHDPVIFSSQQHLFQDVIRKYCIEITGKEGKGKRLARRLERNVSVIHHDKILADGAREVLLDQAYLKKAVKILLSILIPQIGTDYDFECASEITTNGIRFNTNIDFIKANILYHQRVSPTHSSLSPASILSHLYDVECDLYFASTLLTELATSKIRSDLMVERLSYLVNKRSKSEETINSFNDLVFNDAKALRESVNSNKLDMKEVINVIKKSRKFKEWLGKQSPSADLLKEYYKAATGGSILDKLPVKTSRWAVFTGLGLAVDAVTTGRYGVATGVAISALDNFFLEKLIKGWNPSQFIEGDVKNMLKKPS